MNMKMDRVEYNNDLCYQCTSHSQRKERKDTPDYIYTINNKEIATLKSKLLSLEETGKNYYKLQSDYRIKSNHITNLNESIIHLQRELSKKNHTHSIEKLNQENDSLRARVKDKQTEQRILDKDMKSLQFHYENETNDKDQCEKQIKEKEEYINELSESIFSLRRQQKELHNSNYNDTLLIERKQKDIEDVRHTSYMNDKTIKEMRNMNNDIIAKQINELAKKNTYINDLIIKEEEGLHYNKQSIINHNKNNYDTSNQININQTNIEKITEVINEKRSELNKIEDINRSLMREIKMKETEIMSENDKVKISQEHIAQLKTNSKSLNEEVFNSASIIRLHKDTIDTLIKQNKILSSELESVLSSDTEISQQLVSNNQMKQMIGEIKSLMTKKTLEYKNSLSK